MDELPITIPTELQSFLHSMAQKGLTVMATGLGVYGLSIKGQAEFVSIVLSVLMFVASVLWTWLRTQLEAERNVALANAKPPAVPVELGHPAPIILTSQGFRQ